MASVTLSDQTLVAQAVFAGQTLSLGSETVTAAEPGETLRVYGTGTATMGPGYWERRTIVDGPFDGPAFDGSHAPAGYSSMWLGDPYDSESELTEIANGDSSQFWLYRPQTGGGTSAAVLEDVPMPPGPYAARLVVLQGADAVSVRVRGFDQGGVEIFYKRQNVPSASPGWYTVVNSGVLPDRVATISIQAFNALGVASPQVVCGDTLPESWVIGQRANVVVDGSSHNPLVTIPGHSYTAGEVTLSEVELA